MKRECKIEKTIYCCPCQKKVEAMQIPGRKAYPHRADLAKKQFWQCPYCLKFVGSHKNGEPLGSIPTRAIRDARKHIHARLDPLWKGPGKRGRRAQYYKLLSSKLGHEFHTAEIRSIEEARKVWDIINGFYRRSKQCPF